MNPFPHHNFFVDENSFSFIRQYRTKNQANLVAIYKEEMKKHVDHLIHMYFCPLTSVSIWRNDQVYGLADNGNSLSRVSSPWKVPVGCGSVNNKNLLKIEEIAYCLA